ncbi:hypothetical protein E0K83_07550 [Gramella sp. BOM4]|nr:hypothetical protein [Christiangramia bathymodioli]
MSHYISANLGGKELVFSEGLNWRSISALSESGWSIYDNYEDYSENETRKIDFQWPSEYNKGVSGSGSTSTINHSMAKKAYKNAFVWALAFKQSFPGLYAEQYSRAVEIFRHTEEEFDHFLSVIALEDSKIEKELQELIKCQQALTEDEKERAFGNFWRVIYFSFKIFVFTSTGEEAEVHFS